jgi:hypothetical protein
VKLRAGYDKVSFDINGHLFTANGSGQYGLDLTLQGDITTDPLPDTGDILANLNTTQWVGDTGDAPTPAMVSSSPMAVPTRLPRSDPRRPDGPARTTATNPSSGAAAGPYGR